MKSIFTVAIILILSSIALGQEKQNPNQNSGGVIEQPMELPVLRNSPPKISLPRVLKLAESQMKRQRIVPSQYYLAEAKYTLAEFEGHSFPCWRLLWVQENSRISVGRDIEAYVFMNGRVSLSQ